MFEVLFAFIIKYNLIFTFFFIGFITLISQLASKYLFNNRIESSVIVLITGLVLSYLSGLYIGGTKGLADVAVLSGVSILGSGMFRDLAIVASAYGIKFEEVKKGGVIAIISMLLGIVIPFIFGVIIAVLCGYTNPVDITTVATGAVTFITVSITGPAIGATSDLIALGMAGGILKAILVLILTPYLAKYIGLNNPQSAIIYGAVMGVNSGVIPGLAATDPKLVPYGAIGATLYTSFGVFLCPSVFFLAVNYIFG